MPKLKFQPSVTCLISTHDRVEDARINMEIIRAFWKTSGLFSDIHIVHAYNGQKHWYPQAHLENMLIRKKNPGHFQGAAELIDAGMARIIKQFPRTDYVVGLASDTWLTKPAFVYGLLAKMKRRRKTLAAAAWGLPRRNNPFDVGISSDFFIADFDWVRKYALFPLRYAEFEKRHGELLVYIKGSNVSLEKLFFARFQQACFRELPVNNKRRLFAEARLLRISEREPVHGHVNPQGLWMRKFSWPRIGIETQHDPKQKQQIVKRMKVLPGPHAKKLRDAKSLKYFATHTTQY